ncbi:MAG: tRNA pseudouridine(55) synthase TruB [Balneolaceae bacterium]|nr:tRNA pseudouridine(55) synthase TruB [Balneolaceae bacterium]MBO6546490.1 tRNA pseudouridine(55) synthase TruB [Balneolaceae bacterium]MBO6648849.1 tRNA pseudouridine(55) synthase TruB [Balneolaceae bacterium]
MAKPLPLETIPVFSKENPPSPDFDYSTGAILLVNKEKDWTSFDAVKYIRGRVKTKKVGHAGTLDPMATGLLIICTGRATKSISQLQDMSKTYIGEVTFGGSTPSYDAESDVDETAPFDHITKEKIREILNEQFNGEIQQVPPMYSALKRDGKKLYELARRGKTVELEARPVTIHDVQIIQYEAPKLVFSVSCSKGTYIRSIAHDLGITLESRGHLSALERTQIGSYSSANAYTPHEIDKLLRPDG